MNQLLDVDFNQLVSGELLLAMTLTAIWPGYGTAGCSYELRLISELA